MIKKVYKQKYFSLSLILLKDKMVLRMKNFNIFEVNWKIWLLGRGGVTKNRYIGGIA